MRCMQSQFRKNHRSVCVCVSQVRSLITVGSAGRLSLSLAAEMST